ncbi:MAG TPA: hypothetical protein VD968_05380 [Pyrinomonadaceae bacterium]|nr:hypothetical protein [Pyrinomonadaceae bacterium]
MSDNPTQETHDSRSFEERVFARFDALDRRMGRFEERMAGFESRLTSLEEKVDTRLRETWPIWESVQARRDGIETELKSISRGMILLHEDNLRIRIDQRDLRERVAKLEPERAR